MEAFKDILNELMEFRKLYYRRNIKREALVKDIATIFCTKIVSKYIILPATKRNIEFADFLKANFEDAIIYDKYKHGRYENSKTISSLMNFLIGFIKNNSSNTQKGFEIISDKSIIIEKNESFTEFIEVQKVGSLLSGKKKFSIKGISKFNGSSPSLDFWGDGISKIVNREYKKIYNDISIDSIHVSSNNTFTFNISIFKDLKSEYNIEYFKTIKTTKEYKSVLVEEARNHMEKVDNFNCYDSKITSVTIYLTIKKYNELKKELGELVYGRRRYVSFENNYYKEKDDKLNYKASIIMSCDEAISFMKQFLLK